MKKVMIVGSLGQIGTELTNTLRKKLGSDQVLATDLRPDEKGACGDGPFKTLDARDLEAYGTMAKEFKPDTIMHLAGILSANAEAHPHLAWGVNMGGLYNALEVAREIGASIFYPSSIAAFGPDTPADKTPQDTIQRPNTIYGVTKVAGELLAEYYHKKWDVDTRGVRFPGLISWETPPGGGTTDYAVDIYYQAILQKKYECFLKEGTFMDMMYMDDAINGVIQLMEADGSKLKHRCCFNITAMSFDPEMVAEAIKKRIPEFTMTYKVDPVRQAIADSWPNSIDDTAARQEWGWSPKFDLERMTDEMLKNLRVKLAKEV